MATKKITKGGIYNIQINSKSKDTVYELKNSSLASSVTLNFVRDESYASGFASGQSKYFKSGKDLVITTVYGEKLITNTFKDYFVYNTDYPSSINYPDLVKTNGNGIGNPYNISKGYANGLFTDANYTGSVIVGSKSSDSYVISKAKEGGVELHDHDGNDNYNMSNNTNVLVKDKKGNDIYRANNVKQVDINDDAGNDKYSINKATTVLITDSKGKDIYEINASGNTSSEINDKAGNDKYLLTNGAKIFDIIDELGNDSYECIATSIETTYINDKSGNDNYNFSLVDNKSITDYKGNDRYNFYNLNKSSSDYSSYIHDYAGKDNYTVNVSNGLNVIDTTGDDKYNISNSDYLTIEDGEAGSKKGGNDTYNLSNVQQGNISPNTNQYNITDYAGKDKYNISNGSKIRINDTNTDKKTSADKYNISSNSQTIIFDDAGNDVYNVNTSRAYITDELGNDKYAIVDGNNFYKSGVTVSPKITDKAGNDSYKISNSKVDDLTDNAGKDTYTISSNSIAKITDKSASNDTYKINGMNNQVKIDDQGGTKDKLTLSDVNKNNLIFMADFDSYAQTDDLIVNSGALFVFDKTNNGFIKIDNYFDTIQYGSDPREYIQGKGDGYIESILVGKKNISKDLPSFESDMNQIVNTVTNWLINTSHEYYDDISDLINTGNAADIADFISTMSTALS